MWRYSNFYIADVITVPLTICDLRGCVEEKTEVLKTLQMQQIGKLFKNSRIVPMIHSRA